MTLPPWFQNAFLKFIDAIFSHFPQPIPSNENLNHCKLISHRGAYDNRNVFENTIAAFDRIKGTGVWGIEFDLRWTKDLHPVVFHDRNLNRLFSVNQEISQLSMAEIETSFPLIPTLEEMIARYGQKLHLIIEIKEEFYPDPVYQSRVLNDVLAPLKPLVDYHLISLDPNMFQWIDFLSNSAFLPIAEINVASISKIVIKEKYQGILGHYLLITNTYLKRHHQNDQMIGTGFVNSKNCLFRELNRGVTWIFSQNALEMQVVRDRLLSEN
jgi:glycerophosphoryl diester phosphodiesterase